MADRARNPVLDALRAAEELLEAMPAECVLARPGHVGTIVCLPHDDLPVFNLIDATAHLADLREAAGFLVEVLGFRDERPARRRTSAGPARRFLNAVPQGFVIATVRGDWSLLRTSEALELSERDGRRRACTLAKAARLLAP